MASMLGVMSSSSPEFDDMFFPRLSVIWLTLSRDYSSFLTDLAAASVRLVNSIDRAGQAMRAGQVTEAGLCNEVEITVWSPDRPDRCGRSASSGRPNEAGSNSAPTATRDDGFGDSSHALFAPRTLGSKKLRFARLGVQSFD